MAIHTPTQFCFLSALFLWCVLSLQFLFCSKSHYWLKKNSLSISGKTGLHLVLPLLACESFPPYTQKFAALRTKTSSWVKWVGVLLLYSMLVTLSFECVVLFQIGTSYLFTTFNYIGAVKCTVVSTPSLTHTESTSGSPPPKITV